MTRPGVQALFLLFAVLTVAACTSGPDGVRITKDGTSATSSKQGQTIRNYSAAEVSAAIAGKTFQYTRSDGNGFITYNADGSFEYQDDQKGAGTGRWAASGTQYCETFGSKAQECGIFKSTGDAFFAANSRLVEMKV
jgi:outer membrane biogenesis lipoprotein LolB